MKKLFLVLSILMLLSCSSPYSPNEQEPIFISEGSTYFAVLIGEYLIVPIGDYYLSSNDPFQVQQYINERWELIRNDTLIASDGVNCRIKSVEYSERIIFYREVY